MSFSNWPGDLRVELKTRFDHMKPRAAMLFLFLSVMTGTVSAEIINQTFCVRPMMKTMNDGATIMMWGYTTNCAMIMPMPMGEVPGPVLEIGAGDTLNLTLDMTMAPQEPPPYNGHTVHLHGADLPAAEDGVPETNGGVVDGDTYTWSPTSDEAGSYMYHCHVHTVKHLEMGMYGALIVRPRNLAGAFIDQLTPDVATAYDFIETYVISSVDPAYHFAMGDSTVFADYNPQYFLLNGNEGPSSAAPANILAAATGSKVALRLIGLHSVNGTFTLRDGAGNLQPFTIHVADGRSWAVPETVTSVDVNPGQRYDIIFETPATSGAWFPQFEYKTLRDAATLATVFGSVTF